MHTKITLLFIILLTAATLYGQEDLSRAFLEKGEAALAQKDWNQVEFCIAKSIEYNNNEANAAIKFLEAKYRFANDKTSAATKTAILDFINAASTDDPRKKEANDMLVEVELALFEQNKTGSPTSPTAQKVEEIPDMPFAVIEEVPVFPGCETQKGNLERKKCMSTKISAWVATTFNTAIADDLNLSGMQSIFTTFKIDKNGHVVSIQAKADHPALEKEAQRVLQLLPEMTPGKQRGQAVGVLYSLPIRFQVEEKNTDKDISAQEMSSKDILVKKDTLIPMVKDTLDTPINKVNHTPVLETSVNKPSKPVPFALLDKPPVAEGCEYETNTSEQKRCMSAKVRDHFTAAFNKTLLDNDALKPGRKRILITCLIKTDGSITDISAKAPLAALEEEAIRVMQTLPAFKESGVKANQKVDVLYTFPVTMK